MKSSSAMLLSLPEHTECPGPDKLQNVFEHLVEENVTERVSFKQWISTDRSTHGANVKPSACGEHISLFLSKRLIL
jgi:hypothetical protein